VLIAPHLYRYLGDEPGYAVRVTTLDAKRAKAKEELLHLPATVTDDEEAKRICRRIYRDVATGRFRKDKDYCSGAIPTLVELRDQLAREMRLFGRRSATVKHFLFVTAHLVDELGELSVAEIDHLDVHDWWVHLAKKRDLSNDTKNRVRLELVRLLEEAQSRGFRGNNAARALQPLAREPTMQRPAPSIEELAPAFAYWDGLDERRCDDKRRGRKPYMGHGVYFRLQIALLSRGHEVCTLRWSDIVETTRTITIRPEVEKEHKTRKPKVSVSMLEMLTEHRRKLHTHGSLAQAAHARHDNGLVFPSRDGTQSRAADRTRKVWSEGMAVAGLPHGQGDGYTPHVLRSVGISLLDRAGVSEATIRMISGHDDDATYRHYKRAFRAEVEQAGLILGATLARP
jgi:integrase